MASPLPKLLLLIPVCAVLMACPYESNVALEAGPVEPVDSSLTGYWYGIVKDGSDFFGIEALDISRLTDSTYSITRYGKAIKGDMILPDTAHFTGFTSHLGDQLFMNLEGSIVNVEMKKNKTPVVTTQRVYYISALSMRHDTLTVKTVTDNYSPASKKGFYQAAGLKADIQTQLSQHRNIYDDVYTLSYHKLDRRPF